MLNALKPPEATARTSLPIQQAVLRYPVNSPSATEQISVAL